MAIDIWHLVAVDGPDGYRGSAALPQTGEATQIPLRLADFYDIRGRRESPLGLLRLRWEFVLTRSSSLGRLYAHIVLSGSNWLHVTPSSRTTLT